MTACLLDPRMKGLHWMKGEEQERARKALQEMVEHYSDPECSRGAGRG
jgi:hypothetical protein